MGKSGEKLKNWEKVGKSSEKLEKEGKSGEKVNFSQNGRRRTFWMTKNHFRIAILAISDQYATFFFWNYYTQPNEAKSGERCQK